MARLLVLGNVNLDEIVETAGPLENGGELRARRRGTRLGAGGGNTAVALALAGYDVAVAGVVGADADGRFLRGELARRGVDASLVAVRPGRSRRALILVDPHGERTILSLGGVSASPLALVPAATEADGLYVNVAHADAAEVMAARLGKTLVVGQVPAQPVPRWPAHVLVAGAENPIARTWTDPFAEARQLAGPDLRALVITDGAQGSTAYLPDGRLHVPSEPATVVDTTGAGDAFAAGLLAALSGGAEITAAMRTGAAWAARTVSAFSSVPLDIPGAPVETIFPERSET